MGLVEAAPNANGFPKNPTNAWHSAQLATKPRSRGICMSISSGATTTETHGELAAQQKPGVPV